MPLGNESKKSIDHEFWGKIFVFDDLSSWNDYKSRFMEKKEQIKKIVIGQFWELCSTEKHVKFKSGGLTSTSFFSRVPD